METRVENDGQLLLGHGVVRALDVEGESEATVSLVTDDETLGGAHGDWLRVALLGEGKDAIAVSRFTVVMVEFREEKEDLRLEARTGERLLHIVQSGVDSGLVDPKLFLLLHRVVVDPILELGHVLSHIFAIEVAIDVKNDLTL